MIPIAYTNLTSRTDAGALVPEEVSKEMLGKATEKSAVLQMFRPVPVGRNQVRFPVLSALPIAYFVNGDTGLRQTTEVNWANKYMNVEEISAIMPVPENVIADVDANIWDEAMPLMAEAAGRALDQAVFFGTNAPSSWPTNVLTSATNAANTVTEGSVATAGGYFNDVDSLYAKVEADGFDITGWVGAVSAKSKLRTARDSQGRKLDVGRVSGAVDTLDGYPISYPMRGLWPTTSGSVRLFGGDWSQFVVGVRQDITWRVLDQAVIQDNTGAIVYNLAQQKMVALMIDLRVAWQVANTINNDQPTESARYPSGALLIP
jgi:HK97 family phage major capsid protein